MELNQVRKRVSEANQKDWFSTVSYKFPFRCSAGTVNKTGFSSIYEFVENQLSGFVKIGKELPSVLNNSKEYFEVLNNELIEFIKSYQKADQNILISRWANIGSKFKNRSNTLFLFEYKSPETLFLIDLNRKLPGAVNGAFTFIVGQKVETDKFSLIGALKAYEFLNKDSSTLTQSKGEKISLGKLNSRYEEFLDQAERKITELLSDSNEKSVDFSEAITELKKAKETLFSDWFLKSQSEFADLAETIEKRKNELEQTYGEHLRLKKPAEYWKKRADELGKDGKVYLRWLYVLLGIGGISLFTLLWQIPDGMLLEIFKGDANAIKWTIVYVTFISFIAFGIKTLSKLAYSTYHLKRDAEERYQLTLVYLSLINESKVDEKDRQLILQSLFSRSDTGLLKDDSSPTMPGLIGSVFNKPG